ncbi:hypothetical protein [Maribacter sp. 2-571]|uniref:hypothetical protein n=1 Tax=Maribacter sp. 2-571 TaxID=3417569 RepID=UPI003D33A13A
MSTYHLTFSIYYNKKEWHKLINEIHTLVKDDKRIFNYFLNLSTFRGGHVEFTIEVGKKHSKTCVKHFSGCIEKFLETTPSSNKSLDTINDVFFLDFPNNTIHYGVHDYVPIFRANNQPFESIADINHQITGLIITIFQDFGEETVGMTIEIAIQIMALFCLISEKELGSAITFFNTLLQKEFKKHKTEYVEDAQKLGLINFNDNRNEILGYLEDTMLKKVGSQKEAWEIEWESLVSKSRFQNKTSENQDLIYELLIDAIFNKLDIRNKGETYLIFLAALNTLENSKR